MLIHIHSPQTQRYWTRDKTAEGLSITEMHVLFCVTRRRLFTSFWCMSWLYPALDADRARVTQVERTTSGSSHPLGLDQNADALAGQLGWQHADAQAWPVRSESAKGHFYLPSLIC